MKEEKIKPKFLEKWEKESYEKGWKDGRKELIEEAEGKLIVISDEVGREIKVLSQRDFEELHNPKAIVEQKEIDK